MYDVAIYNNSTSGALAAPFCEAAMGIDFESAIKRISEVVMFENWLRFYFIAEEGEKLFIRLPEQAIDRLRIKYSNLYGLAERLNNTEIDHKTSLNAVCLFVASEIGGVALPEDLIGRVFDSPRFHIELQLFSSWVQAHEEQLDESFMEFSLWQKMYVEWKSTDSVQDYIKTLTNGTHRNVRMATDTTQ